MSNNNLLGPIQTEGIVPAQATNYLNKSISKPHSKCNVPDARRGGSMSCILSNAIRIVTVRHCYISMHLTSFG